jgi:hypothetical protein
VNAGLQEGVNRRAYRVVKHQNSRMIKSAQPTWRMKKAMIWIHSARCLPETAKFYATIE